MATTSTGFQAQNEGFELSAFVDLASPTVESSSTSSSSAITEDLRFFADDKNIFFGDLINFKYELFEYSIPTIGTPPKDSPDGSSFSWSIDQIKSGMFFDLSISSGTYDLLYPIISSIDLPSNTNTGKSFTIDTNFESLKNPKFTIDGPAFNASVDLTLNAALSWANTFDLFGYPLDSEGSVNFGGSANIFDLSKILKANTTNPGSQNTVLEGKKDILDVINLFYSIDLDGFDSEKILHYTGNEYQDIETTGTPDKPLLGVTVDIDDIFPQTKILDLDEKIGSTAKIDVGVASLERVIDL